jgi:Amt family ammonium transporter
VANEVAPYSMSAQFVAQLWAVGTTIVWSGVVSVIAFAIVKATIGLRVTEDQEREGLDTVSHGETAYT